MCRIGIRSHADPAAEITRSYELTLPVGTKQTQVRLLSFPEAIIPQTVLTQYEHAVTRQAARSLLTPDSDSAPERSENRPLFGVPFNFLFAPSRCACFAQRLSYQNTTDTSVDIVIVSSDPEAMTPK